MDDKPPRSNAAKTETPERNNDRGQDRLKFIRRQSKKREDEHRRMVHRKK